MNENDANLDNDDGRHKKTRENEKNVLTEEHTLDRIAHHKINNNRPSR